MQTSSTLAAFTRIASPKSPRSQTMGSTLISYLADSDDTNGTYCLLETIAKPGSEPPPHVHSREDELFYVLEGDLQVFVGGDVLKAGVGGCVFLPRLIPHAFIIRSPSLRMLALFTPGGIEEKFRSLSVPATDRALSGAVLPHPESKRPTGVETVGDLGVRFLSPGEIANEMPAYYEARS